MQGGFSPAHWDLLGAIHTRMALPLPLPLSPISRQLVGIPRAPVGVQAGGRSREGSAGWGLSVLPTMGAAPLLQLRVPPGHKSPRINMPGIVPAGPHAGNCLLLNLSLKISRGTGVARPAVLAMQRDTGQGALRGAAGTDSSFVTAFQEFHGENLRASERLGGA